MCFFRHLISPHVEGTSDKENEKGIEKGIQKGREEGENALGKLMDILLSKGDVANAKLAATDEKARKELYRKYGIIEKP